MQAELKTSYPLLRIQLLGVNLVGHESGNSLIVAGRSLPMLQDVDANQDGQSDAWTAWATEWRDVVILDGQNVKTGVFNLTQHNLATASEYATLRTMLIDAAMASQKPWHNPTLDVDTDVDGIVAPKDVLVIINSINASGARQLPPPTGTVLPEFRYDVDGDGFVAPGDVLRVINYINLHGNSGEGEASPSSRLFDHPLAPGLLAATSWIEVATPESPESPAFPSSFATLAASLPRDSQPLGKSDAFAHEESPSDDRDELWHQLWDDLSWLVGPDRILR